MNSPDSSRDTFSLADSFFRVHEEVKESAAPSVGNLDERTFRKSMRTIVAAV